MIVSAVTVFLHSSADCFLIIAVIYAVLKEYNAGMPESDLGFSCAMPVTALCGLLP